MVNGIDAEAQFSQKYAQSATLPKLHKLPRMRVGPGSPTANEFSGLVFEEFVIDLFGRSAHKSLP